MGQAKLRGTFAERQGIAYDRIDTLSSLRSEDVEQSAEMVKYFVAEQLEAYDRHRNPIFQATYKVDVTLLLDQFVVANSFKGE